MKLLRENEVQFRSHVVNAIKTSKERMQWFLEGNWSIHPLTQLGTSGEREILQTYEKIIPVQLQILLAPLRTDVRQGSCVRSWMHWGLSQAIMMLLMYMSWGILWKDCKIRRLMAMMEFHLKSISLQLSDCWSWCHYSFPVVCWVMTCKLPSTPYMCDRFKLNAWI